MPLHIAACDPWSYGTCPTPERGLRGATGSPVELKNKKRLIYIGIMILQTKECPFG